MLWWVDSTAPPRHMVADLINDQPMSEWVVVPTAILEHSLLWTKSPDGASFCTPPRNAKKARFPDLSLGKCNVLSNDNYPQSTATSSKAYLEKKHSKTVLVIDWPPQSPDLIILKVLCDHLEKKKLNKRTNIERSALEGRPRSLENYWWKLLEEITKKSFRVALNYLIV